VDHLLSLVRSSNHATRAHATDFSSSLVQHRELPPLSVLELGVECVEVHDDHLRSDLFGRWAARYNRFPKPGEFLQVVPPRSAFCECHANAIRRLDRPGCLPPLPQVWLPLNRAERRRKGRGR
jgi:hypothetical protein